MILNIINIFIIKYIKDKLNYYKFPFIINSMINNILIYIVYFFDFKSSKVKK